MTDVVDERAVPDPTTTRWVPVGPGPNPLANLSYLGDWASGQSYVRGNVVVYNGVLYECVQATSAAPVPFPGPGLYRVPAIGSRVHLAAAQTIPSTAGTKVLFDTVDRDDGGWWDAANHWMVAPTTGWYTFAAVLLWAAASAATYLSTQLADETTGGISFQSDSVPANGGALLACGGPVPLTAGHHYSIHAYQQSGANLNVNADARCHFALVQL
ncbi:MAG TPA: carbohydrate-binding protein [Gaiellaceae bacterium]|nr:carbohydrate-binding protein [Gaiellaceae bacterium]